MKTLTIIGKVLSQIHDFVFVSFFSVLFLHWIKTEAAIVGECGLISTDCPLLWCQQGTKQSGPEGRKEKDNAH